MPPLNGIDVSNHQGAVAWGAVAASGVAFAIAKCSGDEGGGADRFADPFFAANWRGMAGAGLVRGAYHYARPSVAAPEASAAFFVERIGAVGGLGPGDLVALDLEDPAVPVGVALVGWTAAWLDLVERALAVAPLLYTGAYYLREHGFVVGDRARHALGRYPLWLASYQDTPPPAPPGWPRATIWQTSASGAVPGVAGPCDTDRFVGTADELRALGSAGAPPFDLDAARDRIWAEADRIEAAGHAWYGRALKAATALSKGDR